MEKSRSVFCGDLCSLAGVSPDLVSLGGGQHGVWVAQQLDPLSPRFNCGGFLQLHGQLDPALLESACTQALAETEALRCIFMDTPAGPRQTHQQHQGSVLLMRDLSGHADAHAQAVSWMKVDLQQPRALDQSGLYMHVLFQLGPEQFLFYLRYHHILMDGYSLLLYWRRIADLYSALQRGEAAPIRHAVSLEQILQEETDYLASPYFPIDQDAWLEHLANAPVQEIQPASARGLLRQRVSLQNSTLDLLNQRAGQLSTRWSVLLIAALALDEHRQSGAAEVVLTLPVSARVSTATRATPAMLANELPLYLQMDNQQTLAGLVQKVTQGLGFVLRHQRYRGETLQRKLGRAGRQARLGGTVVNVVSFDRQLRLGDTPAVPHYLSSGPVDDLLVACYGNADGSNIQIHLDANPELYDQAKLAQHQTRLLNILDALLQYAPDAPLSELQVEAELACIAQWNNTGRDWDLSRSLDVLIEQQAMRTPTAIAVSYGDERLTYEQLIAASDRLAAHLLSLGIGPSQYVGVCEPRSLNLPVALLAIMKTGAAYLPLDPAAPPARLAFQVQDAGVGHVLSRRPLFDLLTESGANLLPLDDLLHRLPAVAASLPSSAMPDSAAYVIYTSGSTGQPKGVAVPHCGVVNRLLWMQAQYGLTTDDRILQKTPYTFDVSVWEFFWPLITGARLVIAESEAHHDPRRIAALIQQHQISTLHFVPPMLDLFLESPGNLPSLRRVVCSGDALRPATVAQFFQRFPSGVGLYNLYGPTEASIDVTHWTCSPADAYGSVPIGHPVANTQIHLLDPAGRPVPLGATGELYIAGVQVALGYLNRPELTAERFIVDPWRVGGRLYRTGDLARYRDDGAIEFLGRIDHQLKIRGLRVEAGEVESALMRHPTVQQAVVSAWQPTEGERRLIAHVVPALDQTPDQAILAAHLATQLPDYMIPQHVVLLDALPLSSNGKLDRTALPAPQLAIGAQTTDWQSPQEAALAAVWQTLLGIVPPSDVSFFALGGDSMLAIRSRALLEQQGYTHEVTDLFRWPTIRQLAPQLRSGVTPTISSAPFALLQTQDRHRISAEVEDAYPLSAMQGGMLFHAELAQDSSVYRVVTSLNVRAPFDEAALRQALDATVLRHPILRTYFDLSSYSEPLQLVAAHARAPLEVLEYTENMAAEAIDADLEQWVAQAKNARFDLSQAPLMRFTVHLRDTQQFQLSVVEHHVILDGWSDAAMLEEILQRYQSNLNDQDLWFAPLASSYRDFIATERATLADPQARDFWQAYLQDAEPTLLPRRQGKPSAKAHSRAWPVVVELGMLGQLQQLARQQGLPLKNLLCAAHVMVQRLAGNTSEVLTGLVVNARLEHEGGDEVLGVFLNTLPLRLDTQAQTPLSLAQAITRFEQHSAPWRRYPLTAMGLEVTLDSYFNFIDFHSLWQQQGQQGRLVQQGIGVAETNFPLAANFLVDPVSHQLQVWLDCDPAQLDEAFCQRLAGYYSRALNALLQHADTPLSKLDLLNPVEHAQFAAWNHTAVPFDRNATVHALIAVQAAAQPEAIAVLHRDQQISYRQLQERANQLAHHLHMQGVEPGSLVGISLYRGVDMVVALLAVLQAGCAYVPLDPDYPLARLHYIVQDAQMAALITCEASPVSQLLPQTVLLDAHAGQIAQHAPTSPGVVADGEAAAYVIYTSGSTGNPKGTRIRHRNVINFFAGMDERIGCTQDDVVLAQTSISFDISVLEILWPLARGARVVMAGERILHNLAPDPALTSQPLQLSLFFFAAPAGQEQQREGYQLLLDAAKEADRLGLAAIWTPERHFHEFGGLYPNPSVMMAALASVTQRIGLRCGSVVAPLHDSLRLAEEWSLVDNLSGGRVGLAFASGWNCNDFALAPQNYADRKQLMNAQLEEFRQLWRGEALLRMNGSGEQVALRIYPQPVQAEPQIWLTSAGAVDTFARAGASGANLLTHLLGQDLDELAKKISAYRLARQQAGHAGLGHVTLMVHTFLGDDAEAARAAARGPFRDYLRTSTELWKPLFASMGVQFDDSLSEADLDSVLERAVDRYFERAGLFGSPESVVPDLRALAIAGANEIACLIDFGLPREAALHGVSLLGRLKQLHEAEVLDGQYNLAQLCQRHEVSVLQGTPSLLAAVTATPAVLTAMSKVRSLLVGGEAFPMGLAERLQQALPATQIFNMYGPTETTVWSTVHALQADTAMEGNTIPIGRPIANTEILILNDEMQLVPAGVAGELWIGGDGVAERYVGQPELTTERFVSHPNGEGVLYRTGDRARWREDGQIEFLGRVDRQVKILGHRIEPDEVESVLSRHPAVEAVAVIARTVNGQSELAAYIVPNLQGADAQAEQDHVAHWASIWEHVYADPNQGAVHSEFAGWASSYTGEEIASSEMKEWLKHTVNSVLELQPRTLVEVGVGTGLLLRHIAPRVQRYIGYDISDTALTAAQLALASVDYVGCEVTLLRNDASVLAQLPTGTADTVVINSVIQYFPCADYLSQVLRDAVRVTGEHGAVFIGDVRHLGLLDAFLATVQLGRMPPLSTVTELAGLIARQRAEESELCLAPEWFAALKQHFPGHRVQLALKRGAQANEMSVFRFDVTLAGAQRDLGTSAGPVLDWASSGLRGLDDLRTCLQQQPMLQLCGIPNRRLIKPLALLDLLATLPPQTSVWELERQLWLVDESQAIEPEALALLAEQMGLQLNLMLHQDSRMDFFDACFRPAAIHSVNNHTDLSEQAA